MRLDLFHRNLVIAAAIAFSSCSIAQEAATTIEKPNPNKTQPKEDWARQYLIDDPLATRESITLDDIRSGIDSPRRRDTIISQHLDRVSGITADEKVGFLTDALRSEFPSVQQQAAEKLQEMHALEGVVRRLLLSYLDGEDPKLRNAAIVGLERLQIPPSDRREVYWSALLSSLGDSDESVAQSAQRQLIAEGVPAVPYLLSAIKSDHPQLIRIVQTLSEIVGTKEIPVDRKPKTGMRPMTSAPEERTVGKGTAAPQPQHTARHVDSQRPRSVTVFFGTNRELIHRPPPRWDQVLPYLLLALLLIVSIYSFFSRPTRHGESTHHPGLRWLFFLMLSGGVVWSLMMFREELQQRWKLGTGPSFGSHRDATEKVHYGTCEVSIPPRHRVGAVERPILGAEDEQEHVVLKKTTELEDQIFFDLVKSTLQSLPHSEKSCFVFIHGFNVDFESAARRTAQMHYDLNFEGVPIFFSWPSRASVRHYFSDRNEIEFSRYVIKQFLLDVSERLKADRIHVIAHSMGADATSRAIAELGDRGKIFDQIILAAPDIDREVFRVQIAPRLTKTASRTTLYCSRNDFALLLSRNFNDSTRAGDSSQGALVLRDVDTVDASGIDTDLLGHSYYGDCLPLLDDVQKILRSALTPQQRQLLPWPVDDQLLYWTLPEGDSADINVEK
ncbi:MAG: alpha/beta hydrolase [Planctomycetes bacterium]|nr:alpha/beta hydrolase [Planctomycetota bacterium]